MWRLALFIRLGVLIPILFLSESAFAQAQNENTLRTNVRTAADEFWSRLTAKTSVGFFNFTSANVRQVHERAGQLDAHNYFTFDYHLGRGQKFSLRPVFQIKTGVVDQNNRYQEGELAFGDPYFVLSQKKRFEARPDLSYKIEFKAYAPVSESSQNAGLISRLRPEFTLSHEIARRFEIAVVFEPDYYIQRRAAYVAENGYVNTNKNFGYESKLELAYQLSQIFGASSKFGYKQTWYHTGITETKQASRRDRLGLEAGLTVSLGPTFWVAGLSQERDVLRPRQGLRPFHPEETSYFLLTSHRF